jgi:hypothetical protein
MRFILKPEREKIMNKKIINNISYQLIWWASVLGAIFGYPFIGFWVMIPVLLIHFMLISKNKREIYLLLFAALAGTAMDTLLNVFDIVQYAGTFTFAHWLAPIWITSMWIGFSMTVNHSLNWLANRKLLALFLGMVFGPMAYFAGQRYGAVELYSPNYLPLIILSVLWGMIIPSLYIISEKLKIGVKNEI